MSESEPLDDVYKEYLREIVEEKASIIFQNRIDSKYIILPLSFFMDTKDTDYDLVFRFDGRNEPKYLSTFNVQFPHQPAVCFILSVKMKYYPAILAQDFE